MADRISRAALRHLVSILAKQTGRPLFLETRSGCYGPYTVTVMEYLNGKDTANGVNWFGPGRYYKPAELASVLSFTLATLSEIDHPTH